MKKLFLILFFMLFSTSTYAQEPSIPVKTFESALAYGKLQELNQLSPQVEKSLMLRLYAIPFSDQKCFTETEGVCQNQYLLSLSTLDEKPEVRVFQLKVVGEITKVEWLPITQPDSAELMLQVNQYSKAALKNNPKLKNKTSKVILKVSPEKLIESPL